jgi:putative membrane protein
VAYLKDPRVFYAIERTYLAWVRTQLSILALAFLIKEFGLEDALSPESRQLAGWALVGMCILVVVMSVASFWQCRVSISRLGEEEIPSPSAVRILYSTALVAIGLNVFISVLVALV